MYKYFKFCLLAIVLFSIYVSPSHTTEAATNFPINVKGGKTVSTPSFTANDSSLEVYVKWNIIGEKGVNPWTGVNGYYIISLEKYSKSKWTEVKVAAVDIGKGITKMKYTSKKNEKYRVKIKTTIYNGTNFVASFH